MVFYVHAKSTHRQLADCLISGNLHWQNNAEWIRYYTKTQFNKPQANGQLWQISHVLIKYCLNASKSYSKFGILRLCQQSRINKKATVYQQKGLWQQLASRNWYIGRWHTLWPFPTEPMLGHISPSQLHLLQLNDDDKPRSNHRAIRLYVHQDTV